MNYGVMGLKDDMSYDAMATQLDDSSPPDSGTILGSQAKDLYGSINKFNNEFLKM